MFDILSERILVELSRAALQHQLEVGAWGQALDSPVTCWKGALAAVSLCVRIETFFLFIYIYIYTHIYIPLIFPGLHNSFFIFLRRTGRCTPHFQHFSAFISGITLAWLTPFTSFLLWSWPRRVWDREWVLSILGESVSYAALVLNTKLNALQKLSRYENPGSPFQVWFSNGDHWES